MLELVRVQVRKDDQMVAGNTRGGVVYYLDTGGIKIQIITGGELPDDLTPHRAEDEPKFDGFTTVGQLDRLQQDVFEPMQEMARHLSDVE